MKIQHICQDCQEWIIQFVSSTEYKQLYFNNYNFYNWKHSIYNNQISQYKDIIRHKVIKEYNSFEELFMDIPELMLL